MSKFVNILIIDDNQNNLLSLRSFVEEEFDNINVFEANSGLVALSLLLKQAVDLIFLDIQMPQMDGFETAKMIQKRQKTRHVPIVFMTAAYRAEEFQAKGFDLGAVDYLAKPIDNNHLRNKIQTYLRLIQQTQKPNEKSEQDIQVRITEIVSEASQSIQQEIVFERKQVEYLNKELQSSIKAIITYNGIVKQQALGLGYNKLLTEIEKISLESQHLQDLVNNILDFKLKKGSH